MESSASQLADPLEAVLIEAGLSSLKERFTALQSLSFIVQILLVI